MENSNLFVITGGPGAGKTSVLRELTRFGFTHTPEVAREIIQEQNQTKGTAVPWGDRQRYTQLMLERSIDAYLLQAHISTPAFSDRGIPDTLCYARLIALEDTGPIEKACRLYRYAPTVFIAPPWTEIYETDKERKQDYAEAERTFTLMVEVYSDLGYELVELPKVSPITRAQFIVEQLRRMRAWT